MPDLPLLPWAAVARRAGPMHHGAARQARALANGLIRAWTPVQYKVYGREQDMEMLRESDIIWGGRNGGFVFGAPARGEEGKAGSNQGVVAPRGA
eukprot:8754200-Pyramimonas_sp.AAC.1